MLFENEMVEYERVKLVVLLRKEIIDSLTRQCM